MKYNQLIDKLTNSGCYVLRHGKRHDFWYSPLTGKKLAVPRHGSKEVKNVILAKVYKDLLGQ
ncbi:MAG: type II toxin-antitoxin system HicA family toxin [Prevotella sp.]|nr:type II toxin-antitoxin system HicA family toxin [Prevotella sp.]